MQKRRRQIGLASNVSVDRCAPAVAFESIAANGGNFHRDDFARGICRSAAGKSSVWTLSLFACVRCLTSEERFADGRFYAY